MLVFSAYAEVFLSSRSHFSTSLSFLRVRGGVSEKWGDAWTSDLFSPRTRRCFRTLDARHVLMAVFSAYAEVFPESQAAQVLPRRFLRVRGGVSANMLVVEMGEGFSPRTRRCFYKRVYALEQWAVFSAYAEVFLLPRCLVCPAPGFLRVRGGVSTSRASSQGVTSFSPRTRRCFWMNPWHAMQDLVFSAYAEVFPLSPLTW